jgi:hypothetical protein
MFDDCDCDECINNSPVELHDRWECDCATCVEWRNEWREDIKIRQHIERE